jgi:NAD(P)H-dependent flavin oxidoreductase YrpB (nitropropane dioxygenase family)
MLRTPWTDEWESPEGPGPLPMPIQPLLVSPALQRIYRGAGKEGSGANQLATYFVGQVVGSMNSVQPTRRVVMEMIDEFIDTVQRLEGFLHDE